MSATARWRASSALSWVGVADELPPGRCDRAVVFAPAGDLVPVALAAVRPGGTVSLAGIHMSDLPSMPYDLLWHERSLRSVANMTRADAQEFMDLAASIPELRVEYEVFPLAAANDALAAIKADAVRGAPCSRSLADCSRLDLEAPREAGGMLRAATDRVFDQKRTTTSFSPALNLVMSLPGPGRKLICESSTTRSSWSSGIST